jgi:hypothetical protein
VSHDLRRCPNCGAYVMSERNICPRCDHPLNEPPSDLGGVPETTSPADESGVAEVALPDAADNQAAPDADSAEIAPEAPPVPGEAPVTPAQDRWSAATTQLPQARPALAGIEGEPVDVRDDDLTGSPPGSPPDEREEPGAQDTGEAVPVAEAAPEIPAPAADTALSGVEEGQEPQQPEGEAEVTPEPVETQPHLEEQFGEPAEPEVDATELPTARYAADSDEPAPESGSTVVAQTPSRQAGLAHPAYIVPPAPYTPPPVPSPLPPAWITPPPAPTYAVPVDYGYASSAAAYFQQRVQAYIRGGYRVHVHGPQEATLSRGKRLGVGGWLLALVTVIGFLWYLLILIVSGFQSDNVYIVVEPDGRVYEDGPGAAHIRQQRSRTGRRWSAFGLIVFVASLVLALILGVVGAVFLTQDRYQAALREAYPAITLLEEHFSGTQANPDDVSRAKDGAVAYAILAGIALVGLWGGATLLVVGTIHASAYHTRVPPLPGQA